MTSTDTAVVFGQGNVALDVARILLTPIDILKVLPCSNQQLMKYNKIICMIVMDGMGVATRNVHDTFTYQII